MEMEGAEYHRHSRAPVAETAKDASRHATPDAPKHIDHRRRCTRHDTSDVLTRIARERVPTAPQVRKRVEICNAGSGWERVPIAAVVPPSPNTTQLNHFK